jgi:hypothetical protein
MGYCITTYYKLLCEMPFLDFVENDQKSSKIFWALVNYKKEFVI